MKPSTRWHLRINREHGTITLEAAIVFPVFLLVILFLITMVRVAVVQMAVQHAASQTAKQIAAYIQPASWAAEQLLPQQGDRAEGEGTEGAGGLHDLEQELGWLPSPAKELAAAVLYGDWDPLYNKAYSELGKQLAEPLLRSVASGRWIDSDRLELSHLILPDLRGEGGGLVEVGAVYELPLRFPFTSESLRIAEIAVERGWMPDPLPSLSGSAMGEEQSIVILSINPSPLRPGNKASVVALAQPNQSLSLSVRYKSGYSKARHLGEVVTDENGLASWEWHVSGNTTPGTWELFVESRTNRVARHFVVERKPKGG